jgi:hypothetical protein
MDDYVVAGAMSSGRNTPVILVGEASPVGLSGAVELTAGGALLAADYRTEMPR